MPEWIDSLAPTLSLGELFVRGTITFLGLTFLLRIVGQREAGGLGMADLLVVLLAVDAAGMGLTGDSTSLADGFVLVVVVLAWSVALDALSYRWPRVGYLLKARPRSLIEDGELNLRAARRELMSDEEVRSQLRLHGIEDIGMVERAFIEPNGMVSIVLREPSESSEASKPPEL